MKIISAILLTLIISEACAFTITKKGDGFEFDYSHFGNGSPIDFILKGSYDVNDDTKREVTAFLNLAGQMFPIIDSIMSPSESLDYSYQFCSGPVNFQICLNLEAHLVIGWTVNQLGVDDEFYNITYVPFLNGHASASSSFTTGFVKFTTSAWTKFLQFEVPISTEFEGFNRFCYSAFSQSWPISGALVGSSSVLSCQDDLSNIVIGGDSHWSCNFGSDLDLTFFNMTNVEGNVKTISDRVCFSAERD